VVFPAICLDHRVLVCLLSTYRSSYRISRVVAGVVDGCHVIKFVFLNQDCCSDCFGCIDCFRCVRRMILHERYRGGGLREPRHQLLDKDFGAVGIRLNPTLGATDVFVIHALSYARYSNSTWPFVTTPSCQTPR
jgi:hypothetical protein